MNSQRTLENKVWSAELRKENVKNSAIRIIFKNPILLSRYGILPKFNFIICHMQKYDSVKYALSPADIYLHGNGKIFRKHIGVKGKIQINMSWCNHTRIYFNSRERREAREMTRTRWLWALFPGLHTSNK